MKRYLVLINALLAASLVLCGGCKKGGDTAAGDSGKTGVDVTASVDSPSGLNLRQEPSTTGQLVVVVPDGSTVTILEEKDPEIEIKGIKGKWTRVTWNGQTGWAFGGFLIKNISGAQTDGKYIYPKAANGWHYLNSLPSEWVLLNYQSDEYSVYLPCMGAQDTLKIWKGSVPRISAGGGTCGAGCEILSIVRPDHPDGLYTYTFTLKDCSYCDGPNPGQKTVTMHFAWADDNLLIKNKVTVWQGAFFGEQDKYYVPAENVKNFKTVNEKCQ